MTYITAIGAGYDGPELPAAPTDEEKNSYAWRSLPYLTTAITVERAVRDRRPGVA